MSAQRSRKGMNAPSATTAASPGVRPTAFPRTPPPMSNATTRAPRLSSARVAMPVPAPPSRISCPASGSNASNTASGWSGRPASYSSATGSNETMRLSMAPCWGPRPGSGVSAQEPFQPLGHLRAEALVLVSEESTSLGALKRAGVQPVIDQRRRSAGFWTKAKA